MGGTVYCVIKKAEQRAGAIPQQPISILKEFEMEKIIRYKANGKWKNEIRMTWKMNNGHTVYVSVMDGQAEIKSDTGNTKYLPWEQVKESFEQNGKML
jgi:hypothetical protein